MPACQQTVNQPGNCTAAQHYACTDMPGQNTAALWRDTTDTMESCGLTVFMLPQRKCVVPMRLF